MNNSDNAVGHAVFIRTDTLDYSETTIPFRNLEELVHVCNEAYANLTLDKVVVYSMLDADPCALTLGFISASKGRRPAPLVQS